MKPPHSQTRTNMAELFHDDGEEFQPLPGELLAVALPTTGPMKRETGVVHLNYSRGGEREREREVVLLPHDTKRNTSWG